jgi:very-short-patch-repair endonuclease
MANYPVLLSRAKYLRSNMTDAEHCIWYHLRSRRLNQWKFRRQVLIETYIVDFVCFSSKVIIELDGSQHNVNKAYDQKRTNVLNKKGFQVLRFWNNDVLSKTESVVENIFNILIKTPHPPCRAPSPARGEGLF